MDVEADLSSAEDLSSADPLLSPNRSFVFAGRGRCVGYARRADHGERGLSGTRTETKSGALQPTLRLWIVTFQCSLLLETHRF